MKNFFPDAKYHLYAPNDEFRALYIYTEDMKSNIAAFPEIALIDGTYKIFRLGYTLVLITNIDGNGQTEIVVVFIMADETEETFRWCLNRFKNENPTLSEGIKCIMADKDLAARDLLKELFECPVYICIFHVEQIFNRTYTYNKMGVDKDTRIKCLKLVKK